MALAEGKVRGDTIIRRVLRVRSGPMTRHPNGTTAPTFTAWVLSCGHEKMSARQGRVPAITGCRACYRRLFCRCSGAGCERCRL